MEQISTSAQPITDWSKGVPLKVGPWTLGLYQPSPETKGYWEAVTGDELVVKRCGNCQRLHHPRRIVCTACGSKDMQWQRVSGRGTVYSFSVVHRAVSPELKDSVPYTVGIVRLEEGVHLFTRFFAEDERPIAIEDAVAVEFRTLELGHYLPVFVRGKTAT